MEGSVPFRNMQPRGNTAPSLDLPHRSCSFTSCLQAFIVDCAITALTYPRWSIILFHLVYSLYIMHDMVWICIVCN